MFHLVCVCLLSALFICIYIHSCLLQIWWSFGSMFGAVLALVVMPTLGWHWYLGLAATPLALVLILFPVMLLLLCVCEEGREGSLVPRPKLAFIASSERAW